jgi:response regulator RpfG family c-di-GMP phosphodiesterase
VTYVLIVDDEPAVRDVISRWMTSFGLRPHSVRSAEEALTTLRSRQYDLAVVDVMMPGRNGLWLAGQMQRECPDTAVVLATAYAELLDAQVPAECADLLVKPFQRERLALAVERGRDWRRDVMAERRWHAQLGLEVRDGVDGIVLALNAQVAAGEDECAALAAIATARVPRTMAHCERVVRFARAIARELAVDGEDAARIELAARFHDVGKAAMPLALLTKPSPLTAGESAIMRRHVDVGADLLAQTATLACAADLVRASHEWYGGGGYPAGLAGCEIPLGSRVIAVADAYDAITQHRSYRAAVGGTEAVDELLRCCPVQFDPDTVDAFLRILSRH